MMDTGQSRFVNEASKKMLEKRGQQSGSPPGPAATTVDAVKTLDAEVAKSFVDEGLQNTEKAAGDIIQPTDQPPPATEASTPTSVSKPAAKAKVGRLSVLASDKPDRKRMSSANEVTLYIGANLS
jgi:hypothetical protein